MCLCVWKSGRYQSRYRVPVEAQQDPRQGRGAGLGDKERRQLWWTASPVGSRWDTTVDGAFTAVEAYKDKILASSVGGYSSWCTARIGQGGERRGWLGIEWDDQSTEGRKILEVKRVVGSRAGTAV